MEDLIKSIGVETVISILGIILSWVAVKITRIMEAKATQLKKHTNLDKYIDIVLNLIEDTVKAFNQTVVYELRKASEDGTLSEADKENVLDSAVVEITTILTEEVKEALSIIYGDLETWITIQVEKYVASEHAKNL